MAADDLSAPLGQNRPPKRKLTLPAFIPQVIAGALALGLGTFAAWAVIKDDPFGGEPIAIVSADLKADASKPAEPAITIQRGNGGDTPQSAAANGIPRRYDGPGSPPPQSMAPVPAAAAGAGGTPAQALPPGAKTVTMIDGSTGKRQEVVIGGGSGGSGASSSATPGVPVAPPDAADSKPAGDQRLAETSRHGSIPRIGEDGTRPLDAYAKPVKPIAGKPDAPRIAIVIGGLGIGTNGTNDAIAKLPTAVSFAFTPYNANLDGLVARAKEHELLLQVPMEPFDYPDNDPGPQTLLTSLDAGQNVDRLQWQMSRFQGYVGLANYMGARFTASETSLAPVMKEAGKRGLLFFDDGSSVRSLIRQLAGANNVSYAKADVGLDTVATAAEIDRALGRLESLARQKGSAIGVASALPVSIDRIARWTKGAESRGILLVPISTVAASRGAPKGDDKPQKAENVRPVDTTKPKVEHGG